ncbi:hypothetical protein WJX73_007378 [Symbiochloris irregularis]|uniref:AP2/ERF domain-containing protein n=1 Tax=Symbiochloris irregularis TaxID=706552 RepID=A0AAW1NUZ3_9CHLO
MGDPTEIAEITEDVAAASEDLGQSSLEATSGDSNEAVGDKRSVKSTVLLLMGMAEKAKLNSRRKPKDRKQKDGKQSDFQGASYHKVTKKWEAPVWDSRSNKGSRKKGVQCHTGSWSSERRAAMAYDIAAILIKGAEIESGKHEHNFDPSIYQEHIEVFKQMQKEELVELLKEMSEGKGRSKGKTPRKGAQRTSRLAGSAGVKAGRVTKPARRPKRAAPPKIKAKAGGRQGTASNRKQQASEDATEASDNQRPAARTSPRRHTASSMRHKSPSPSPLIDVAPAASPQLHHGFLAVSPQHSATTFHQHVSHSRSMPNLPSFTSQYLMPKSLQPSFTAAAPLESVHPFIKAPPLGMPSMPDAVYGPKARVPIPVYAVPLPPGYSLVQTAYIMSPQPPKSSFSSAEHQSGLPVGFSAAFDAEMDIFKRRGGPDYGLSAAVAASQQPGAASPLHDTLHGALAKSLEDQDLGRLMELEQHDDSWISSYGDKHAMQSRATI